MFRARAKGAARDVRSAPDDTARVDLESARCQGADSRRADGARRTRSGRFLIEAVSRNGGHLGPNLGVVELTIALHRVFDSPADPIVWDTGHQSYVHKLLTGRMDGLRQAAAAAAESPATRTGRSPSTTGSRTRTPRPACPTPTGWPRPCTCAARRSRRVVAVIGDGALTGGMAWEALNNIAGAKDRPVVIVVNDNGRSYQRTIGGLADHLASVRVSQRYEQVLDLVKTTLSHTPLVGPPLFETLHGIKKGLKDVLQPQVLFEDLGLKYLGPGRRPRRAGARARARPGQGVRRPRARARDHAEGPRLRAGRGERRGLPAPGRSPVRTVHVNGVVPGRRTAHAAAAPQAREAPAGRTSSPTSLVDVGARRPDVVAITAAMLHPTGLAKFAEAYPDRVFDVGIAEQHAVTSAAGLAMGGMHPVVAIYATFLNRAFDQVLMDVAMHRLPVTFVLDRAGVTGPDGASHHGMWDGSLLQIVPGIRVAVPRDGTRLTELLREAVAVSDGPTALRFPRGSVPDDLPAIGKLGGMDVLAAPADGTGQDVLLRGRRPDGRDRGGGGRAAGRPGHRGHGGRSPLGQADRRGARRSRCPAPARRHRGGQRHRGRLRRRGGQVPARYRHGDAGAHLRPAAAVPRARRARRGARRGRADAAAASPRHHRGGRQAHLGPGSRPPGLAAVGGTARPPAGAASARAHATNSISSGGSSTVKSAPSAARWKVSASR